MKVVNLKGRRGHLKLGEIYVGRFMPAFMTRGVALPASDWANPFKGERAQAVAKYEAWLIEERPDLMARLPELAGHDLACWCAPEPCHADLLARLANPEAGTAED